MDLAILLSTYNSSKYLREQLDSILNQTFTDFKLYIRDDGSTDNTLEIINEYVNINNKIILIKETNKLQKKTYLSFMTMLSLIKADYYMFSDHDDVWLNNKIELSLESIKSVQNENADIPILVHTDLKIVDEYLNPLHDSFWLYSKINPRILNNSNYLSVYNCVVGCTMIINKNTRDICLNYFESNLMHDSFIALKVANANGIIEFISKPTILYRQHNNNVIGAKKPVNFKNLLLSSTIYKEVIFNNLIRYKNVKKINNISLFKFLFYKLIYHFRK